MNKLINKNFEFLTKDDLNFKYKNLVIDSIMKIHHSISQETYSNALSELRKIVELILGQYLILNGYKENQISSLSLFERAKLIQDQYGSQFNEQIMDAIHIVRKWGNKDIHNFNQNFLSEIIVALKSTREIIWYCFGDKSDLNRFDEKIYYAQGNFEKIKPINIIEENENSAYQSLNSNPDILIQKNKLKDWVSSNKIILIPIYQRGYTWTVDHIETLFKDIVNRNEDGSSHYFGIIAGKTIIGSNLMGKEKIKIIDGQQRLTTSFLFFCAIRDVMLERGLEDINNERILSNILKTNSKEKIEDYFQNPGGDINLNEAFRKILRGELSEINNLNAKSDFYKNYSKFKELLNKELLNKEVLNNPEICFPKLRDLLHTFLTKFELGTISFDKDNISNKKEMEIFENLNSKGKELSVEELIKNFIFNLCSDKLLEQYDDKEISRNYIIYITNELNNDKLSIQEFYKTLVHYNTGEEFKDNKQTHLSELQKAIYNLFNLNSKQEISKLEKYNDLLLKIKNYATIFYDVSAQKWKKIMQWMGVEKIINLCNDKNKQKLFVGLTYLIYEFLSRNKLYDINTNLTETIKKDIKKIYLILMKAIIKNSIVTGQGDSSFKRLILKSIYTVRQEFLKDENITINIMSSMLKNKINTTLNTDQAFKISLTANHKASKSIIWLLVLTEWEMSDKINSGQALYYDSPSIEHILPQNTNYWMEEMKFKPEYNESEFLEKKDRYLEKIGNYFVINRPKNSSASNKIFSEKKIIYKANTSPLYNNSHDIDIDISRKNKWDFSDIEKRTEKLINYICENVIRDNN